MKRKSFSLRVTLKKYLIREGLLDEKCSNTLCTIRDKWLGKKIILQLDHINGDPTDNRIGNLRLLCPNCHSQTETFGTKNGKVVREALKKLYNPNEREEGRIREELSRKGPKKWSLTCQQCFRSFKQSQRGH